MKRSIFAALFVFASLVSARAQELQPTVTVDFSFLPQDMRIQVQTLQQDLTNYLNNQRYTGQDWEGPRIPVSINVTLTGATSQNRFNAAISINSSRLLLGKERANSSLFIALEREWNFEYFPNAALTFQQNRFDAFTTLIDFYMSIVIGLDMDTYGELDGTPMYTLAQQLCRLGASVGAKGYGNVPEPGVPSKIALATELTNVRFDAFRKLVFAYHVDGMDSLSVSKEAAQRQVARVLGEMLEYRKSLTARSIFMDTFFNAKFQEIANLFRGYQDEQLWKTLTLLDPQNASVYQQAKENR